MSKFVSNKTRTIWFSLIVAVFFITILPHLSVAQVIDQNAYAGMQWRMIGPFRGGRVNAVSGVPGQPNTFYFGSVGGWNVQDDRRRQDVDAHRP